MKFSVGQRSLFWVGYILFNIFQLYFSFYTVDSSVTPPFISLIYAAIVDTWPKSIFDFLIFYFVTRLFLLKQKTVALSILTAVFLTIAALLAQRSLNFYFTFPEIYGYDMAGSRFYTVSSLIVTLFDILVPVSLLLIYDLYRFAKAARERESQIEKERLRSEMKFLKAQINPHFLFNVLSTVHALSRNKAPEAAAVVVRLSEMMRFILYEVKNKTISLSREIEFLENYIDLEKMRFQNKLQLLFDVNIENEKIQVAPMIFLPFIENAFKHGVTESLKSSFVHIYLHVKENVLEFKVENSVEACLEIPEKQGIGLANVKRQLELIYPAHTLSVTRKPDNYCVMLKIPFINHEKIVMPDS